MAQCVAAFANDMPNDGRCMCFFYEKLKAGNVSDDQIIFINPEDEDTFRRTCNKLTARLK